MKDIKSLQDRFKFFAISIVIFLETLPDFSGFRTVRNQIVRSGPFTAANFRAVSRAKSTADFVHKLRIVEEELDETLFWLEFTVGLKEDYRNEIKDLWKEGNELLSIVVSSINTTKNNKLKEKI